MVCIKLSISSALWCIIFISCCAKIVHTASYATTKCEGVDSQNDMRFFDRLSRQFIHWLQRESAPDDIFKEVVNNWNNKTASKIVNYEWPFLVVSGTLFFSAFSTSVIGFGIIFYKKLKGTKDNNKSIKNVSSKSRSDGYMFLLSLVSCFLIVTDVCLFISNNHLSNDLPHARKTLTSSIDDLQQFQNNTVEELDHILRDDFDREVGGSLNQFRALADCSTGGLDSILKKREIQFNKAFQSALSALYLARGELLRVNMTLGELRGVSSGLRSELGKMNLYFKEAKRRCFSSQQVISGDVCKKFISGEYVFSHKLPQEESNNISEVASRLNKFLEHLKVSSINEILKSQGNIERHLCEERSDKLKELEKLSNGIRIARSFTMDIVKKYANQLAEHSLVPVKDKIEFALEKDGNIGRFDRERWWLSFLVIAMVLLASLITLISLVLNKVQPFVSHLPSNIAYIMELKIRFPLIPKRLLLSSTMVHLVMAVLVNLCAGVTFLVLSNMALVCEVSSHYEKLDDIFGTSNLLKESRLFAKEKKPLNLFKKISECPEDGTLWAMFNLDEKFDIDDSIDQLNGIPRIAVRLFEDGSALKQGRQFQEFHNVFQKWRDIGLGKVNVKLLGEQVNNPILDKSFQKLSEALLSSYPQTDDIVENMTRTPFKMFRSISNHASVIEDNYGKMYSVLSKLLNQHLKSFNKSREQVVASFANMSDIYSDIVGEGITETENELVDRQVVKTVGVIKRFMKDSISKMRGEVGRCGPVKRAYNGTVCLFCRDLFGSWNSWWILLLTCGLLTILSVILCFLILKEVG